MARSASLEAFFFKRFEPARKLLAYSASGTSGKHAIGSVSAAHCWIHALLVCYRHLDLFHRPCTTKSQKLRGLELQSSYPILEARIL